MRRHQNAVSYAVADKALGPITNTVILLILACLIGLLYLTQVTKTNGYGYQIDKLQKQQSELLNQKAELEIATARLQSLDRVAGSSAANGLVSAAPVGTIAQ
ncbi:hypothetical protein A3J32_02230 [Candidatus Saccharibacteria bacterium RIFCSPLOWO2_02_FULL_46_7]|nr:MAG: hypothetical protein A3J32_02230 [Candidatus Saccharibacteria bacterium RIFCSPLOWO2_02_FULL_46_7]